ncbi:MAG TPA: hypothetical protein VFK05_25230 [Polyangiaceae bacterium]|nr:hypothetical protein [Polyangiaceae bacterium]
MKRGAASAALGLALLCCARNGFAQGGVQLRWQAPANCPQEAQVRQKLRSLLGPSAGDTTASRLRAEGQIETVGERFRLTLNIHYDLVNGTRVVQANSCEDLGGVAAVTLALLFRAEHNSSTPLTARDLGGTSANVGADGRTIGSENQRAGSAEDTAETREQSTDAARKSSAAAATPDKVEDSEQQRKSEADAGQEAEADGAQPRRNRFLLRVPELRTDIGVLPNASYGLGLGVGMRHDAWRFLLSGSLWLAQNYESDEFVGYGAHYGRVSGELSACHGFHMTAFELAPCALVWLDDVAARATGVGVSSTNPRTAWLSLGAGLQGIWSLGRHAALVFGVNGRVATSRPRFVMESVGEISQVGPVALGVALGLEWLP